MYLSLAKKLLVSVLVLVSLIHTVASYTVVAALATICVCSCKHNSSWVILSMYAQIKHILALADLATIRT